MRTKANKRKNFQPSSHTPRVKELLQKVIEWKALLDSGEVTNKAEIARCESLSRARVTQIMSLLHLAPEIQEYILTMPKATHQTTITERSLRPIRLLKKSET